jgi:hypothetical protein
MSGKSGKSAKSAASAALDSTGNKPVARRDFDQRPPRGNHHRTDDANAFMPDPEGGPATIADDLAENLAEEYLQGATQGSDAEEDHDQVVPEEIGGPFIETSAAEEFAHDTDETNPLEAEAKPLPRPVAGLISIPGDEDSEESEPEEAGEAELQAQPPSPRRR